ncbi:MAG: diguanylate cyclase [Leptospirales bacterium]
MNTTKQEVILCVDDDPTVLHSLVSQLQEELFDAYIIEAASSAPEAIEIIEEIQKSGNTKLVLIVSDWLMPDMKGDEFLIQIYEKYPSIRSIMLTGHASEAAVSEAEEKAHLTCCLSKPWDKNELVVAIEEALNRSKQVILCIDDEQLILNSLLAQMKQEHGERYDIELAMSGEEGFEILEELQRDNVHIPVIVTDYIMPGMTGDVFLKKLVDTGSNSMNIMLTGQATLEGVIDSVNHGGLYRVVTKPWDEKDFLLTLKQAIQSYNLKMNLKQRTIELQILNKELEQKVLDRTLELENEKEKFRVMSLTDELTQILNRRCILHNLDSEMARSKRYKHSFCIALIDIDNFKRINDTYGHQMGDEVLIIITKIISQTIRSTDSIGRYGGEEFLIVYPETSSDQVLDLLNNIQNKIKETKIPKTDLTITVSGGLSQYSDGITADDMIKEADSFLYKAKENGKDRFEFK